MIEKDVSICRSRILDGDESKSRSNVICLCKQNGDLRADKSMTIVPIEYSPARLSDA